MSASASLSCPGCKTTLKLRADLSGKKVKCPRCGQVIAIPVLEDKETFKEKRKGGSPPTGKAPSGKAPTQRVRRPDPDEEDEPRERGSRHDREGIRTGDRDPDRDRHHVRKADRDRDRHRHDEEEDERPRAKKGKRGHDRDDEGQRGQYKKCPQCGATGAQRVMWTAWGSFYGPALFTHVRCPECDYCYNGKTGRSNAIPIALFVTIPVLGILGIIVAIIVMLKTKNYF